MATVMEAELQVNGETHLCEIFYSDGKVERIGYESDFMGEPNVVLEGDEIPFETYREAQEKIHEDPDPETEEANYRDDLEYHQRKDEQ